MKKALVLAVFACWAAQLTAQSAKGKFSVKPMMGINVTDFSGSLVGDIYHPKVRFAAGAEMEYGITDWLGLTLGAVYSQQGASIDGTITLYTYSGYGSSLSYQGETNINVEGKADVDYINVPIMASIYIPQWKGIAVKAGVQVGFRVNDFFEVKCEHKSLGMEISMGGFSKTVDFGIPIGLSYEHKNFVLDARYYFGLLENDGTEDPDNTKNRYLSITLGYRFHL